MTYNVGSFYKGLFTLERVSARDQIIQVIQYCDRRHAADDKFFQIKVEVMHLIMHDTDHNYFDQSDSWATRENSAGTDCLSQVKEEINK